jgi:hypothetical protein
MMGYLVLGIAAQFLVVWTINGGYMIYADYYQKMDEKLPGYTLFIISIRRWAYAWPVAVLLLAAIVLSRSRTERTILHLFGGMMLVAVFIMNIVWLGFALPFIQMYSNDPGRWTQP